MFILAPLFLTFLAVVYIFYSVLTLIQLQEYILYISQVANAQFSVRLMFQFLSSAALYLIATYWLLRCTTFAFSDAMIKRSGAPGLGFVLRLLVVISPSILLGYALVYVEGKSPLVIAAVVVLTLIVVFEVLLEASRFYKMPWLSYFVPSPAGFLWIDFGTLAVIAAVYLFFAYDIVTASNFLGLFAALFVFLSIVLASIRGILIARRTGHPVISILAFGALALYIGSSMAPSSLEVRSTSSFESPQATKKMSSADVLRSRKLPELSAFREWLRARPNIRDVKHAGGKYPVFVVAAQGGGYYAAYHAALTLAAIQDSCPEFAEHVFAVVGVSGGGVGATVFTELLRAAAAGSLPSSEMAAKPPCQEMVSRGVMANATQDFFKSDFLTPVMASGLLFDSVRLLAPLWPVGPDRARALEYGFEGGWKEAAPHADQNIGMAASFYGHWNPKASVPALFLATTGVNTGTPVLASQINWSEAPDETVGQLAVTKLRSGPAQIGLVTTQTVSESLAKSYVNRTFANVLDFRPDIQLRTSTAAALTARFPFVTPPGIISGNKGIDLKKPVFRDLPQIELVDGGFWDNSGMAAASSIISKLSDDMAASESIEAAVKSRTLIAERSGSSVSGDALVIQRSDIEFHLISLTHADVYLNHRGQPAPTSEALLPITVFDRVRVSRRGLAGQLSNPNVGKIHPVALFDQDFEAPLTWVLAGNAKHAIEVRSGLTKSVSDKDWLCCVVKTELPTNTYVESSESIVTVPRADAATFRSEIGKPATVTQDGWVYSVGNAATTKTSLYLPNAKVFGAILTAIRDEKIPPATSSTAK